MNLQHQEPRAKSEDQHYVLRLFVAGTTPNSLRAIQNVRLSASSFGSPEESVGNWRYSAPSLSEEAVEPPAGGVEGALVVFPAVVYQRAAVLVDRIAD
jgi:hypothetical protein